MYRLTSAQLDSLRADVAAFCGADRVHLLNAGLCGLLLDLSQVADDEVNCLVYDSLSWMRVEQLETSPQPS